MEEKRQSGKFLRYTARAQCLGDVHQVIVVYPNEVVRLRTASDGIGETIVDRLVGLPVSRLEIAKVLKIVKQWPDHFVGIAVIKFVPLGLTKRDWHDFVTCAARCFGECRLWNFARSSGPTDPGPTAFAQHRLHRRNQSSGSRCDSPKIFPRRIQRERQSIGDDDQAIHFDERLKNLKSHKFKRSELTRSVL